MPNIHTSVGIIGAGASGLTLALLLHRAGIPSAILENRSRDYVEQRVRAGLLEHNTVDVFDELDVAERLHREGLVHHGCVIQFDGVAQRIDFQKLSGREVTIYGQQEVVKDLINACLERGIPIYFEATATAIAGLEGDQAEIHFTYEGKERLLTCDFVGGCDGFHGIARKTLPPDSYREYRIEYPFSWLGILAHSKPVYEELVYAFHPNGFALASMRSEQVSRLYLQVPNDEPLEKWPDERVWDELEKRLSLVLDRGAIFEKSITPMRSFMIDKMQHGRLFLAGDAAHIVPPTGAKGLNLAVADVYRLANGLVRTLQHNDASGLETYSEKCLRRIWRVQDFSNFMTYLCHKQSEIGSFEHHLQQSKFEYLRISKAYQKTISENYVGFPLNAFD